jgi:lipopolysaccharide/colanic/teichoic acid biosynthesis glycosyltransferase
VNGTSATAEAYPRAVHPPRTDVRPGTRTGTSDGLPPPAVAAQVVRSMTVQRHRAWFETGGSRRLSDRTYRRLKRLMDLTVALLLLPFALPVIALCMVAVKLDTPGPALLKQRRTGRGGRPFGMFKLRTMVQNAHELKALYMHLNEHTYPDFKISNDPRVTRCGRLLRKLSLDELPQLFNVIRGDMALIGPRPTSFAPETYRLWHTARLDATPGVTGLWQVCGRSDLDFDDRLRLDIAYIRNQSLWLDVQILVRTAGAVWTGRGAN